MQGEQCISLERFWGNANDLAKAMTFIGNKMRLLIPPENLHVTGLFHDCSNPAMAIKHSDYVDVLKAADSNTELSIT